MKRIMFILGATPSAERQNKPFLQRNSILQSFIRSHYKIRHFKIHISSFDAIIKSDTDTITCMRLQRHIPKIDQRSIMCRLFQFLVCRLRNNAEQGCHRKTLPANHPFGDHDNTQDFPANYRYGLSIQSPHPRYQCQCS